MGLIRYMSNLLHHDSNIKCELKKICFDIQNIQSNILADKSVYEYVRTQYLQDKVLNSKESGISKKKLCNYEVVVSLTTYGVRIYDVYLAIESIMQGTVKPNRIVLWLSKEEFLKQELPVTLQKQVNRGLEISFCEDIKSYKKLIPTLCKYPDACIITIDDDVVYNFDLVEKLICTHQDHPVAVCANRIHRIKLDDNKMPISYMNWNWRINDYTPSKLNFFTGVGGVLYPPHIFPKEVFNQNVFMEICKYADDIWFNAMLLLNHIEVIKSYTKSHLGDDFVEIKSLQHLGLCQENTNVENCRNDIQIKAVWERYDLTKLFQ